MKKSLFAAALIAAPFMSSVSAAEYEVDVKGAHASINFAVPHLGYSMLTGRFNKFSGSFEWDATNPETSAIEISIKTDSIDSNHAKRDKHLRSDDFLNSGKHKRANFKSSSFKSKGGDNYELVGDLTLMGVTKPITIDVTKIGEGKDPWGGYRVGFSGTATLVMADYGIKMFKGTPSGTVQLDLHVEGIRK